MIPLTPGKSLTAQLREDLAAAAIESSGEVVGEVDAIDTDRR